jgi:hypothetical protein
MVYHTQNCWVSGFRPEFLIRKHGVSKSWSVSVLRRGEGDSYSVGSLRLVQ